MAEREPTHYDRLGSSPTASTDELRQAYRGLAQRLHPDRQVGATPAERALAERRMREVNQAWEVLRDPERRRRYDEARLGSARRPAAPVRPNAAAVAPSAEPDDDLVDVAPAHGVAAGLFRHLPWVLLVVLFVGIFIFSAYASNPGKRSVIPTTTVVQAGSCVDVVAGPSTTVVPCSGPHDLRIELRVEQASLCPAGTEPRRLGTDGLVDCVTTS